MIKIIDLFNRKEKLKEIEKGWRKPGLEKNELMMLFGGIILGIIIASLVALMYIRNLEAKVSYFETLTDSCASDCLVSPEIAKYMETYCNGCVLGEEDME